MQIITTNKPTSNVLQAGCPSCHSNYSVRTLKGNVTDMSNNNNNKY